MPYFNTSLLSYSFTKHLMSSHHVASELVLGIQQWIKFGCGFQGVLQLSGEAYEWIVNMQKNNGYNRGIHKAYRNTEE